MNYSNNDCIILLGDSDVRTSEFVETIGDKYLGNTFIVNCNRNNQDTHLNSHDKIFMQVMQCNHSINGRKSGDSFWEKY